MLDRAELFNQLQALTVTAQQRDFFGDKIKKAWDLLIAQQESLRILIAEKKWHFALPLWFESPDALHKVATAPVSYGIVAVDGSQIYPDRYYSNLDCFMLNIGGLNFAYGAPQSSVAFFSKPYLFTMRDVFKRYGYEGGESKDLIDLMREEFEFKEALAATELFCNQQPTLPSLTLFDGSFIFWHLEGKPAEMRELFLSTYMLYLRKFQEKQLPIAAYISLPRSRELCNVLRFVLCDKFINQGTFCFLDQSCACKILQECNDVEIVANMLKPGYRTGIFMSSSSIADAYFDQLRPCFFFINVGEEIARVELPWWMAQDRAKVDFVAALVLDQSKKGQGYPIVLAEAHERAVVKQQDKRFFYDMIDRIFLQNSVYRQTLAMKNLRKRRMPV